MEPTAPYSHQDWVRAVNASSFLGWALAATSACLSSRDGSLLNVLSILPWAALIGLPIAFGAGWIIAAPILKRAMRSRITWAGAAFLGGGIALLIALASIVIGRFRGWVQSMNPDTVSQIGGGDKVREIDGLLTAFGWATLAQTTAFVVAGGVLIALMVRALIGPGRAE